MADISYGQLSNVEVQATAMRFLDEVPMSLTNPADYSESSDTINRLDYADKQAVLGQIANYMDQQAVMAQLGLNGSVERDSQGNITSLDFSSNSPDPNEAYAVQQLEDNNGESQLQAQQDYESQNPYRTPSISYDVAN